MRYLWLTAIATGMLLAGTAWAQESEFQKKLQDDMDYYKAQIADNCGAKVTFKWLGKLGHDPRETEKPKYNGVSNLVTSGIEALVNACTNNTVVKKKMSGLKKIEATKGKGTIGYKLRGTNFLLTVDPSFTTSAGEQRNALIEKLKKDIDK